jgi:hypothetical protein
MLCRVGRRAERAFVFARLHAAAIRYVEVETESVNTDVDTPDVLQELGIQGEDKPCE